jgi:hypothetical protein
MVLHFLKVGPYNHSVHIPPPKTMKTRTANTGNDTGSCQSFLVFYIQLQLVSFHTPLGQEPMFVKTYQGVLYVTTLVDVVLVGCIFLTESSSRGLYWMVFVRGYSSLT